MKLDGFGIMVDEEDEYTINVFLEKDETLFLL